MSYNRKSSQKVRKSRNNNLHRDTAHKHARHVPSPSTTTSAAVKFHGVIRNDMVEEQTASAGFVPFTFSTSVLLLISSLIGAILVPQVLSICGVSYEVTLVQSLPLCVACALGYGRYFVDTKRGLCRGFFLTVAITYILSSIGLYCLLFMSF